MAWPPLLCRRNNTWMIAGLWILCTVSTTLHFVAADDSKTTKNTTHMNATLSTAATPIGNTSATPITDLHCVNNYGICLSGNQSCASNRARVSGICDEPAADCCVATVDERNTWKKKDGDCLKSYGECMLETHDCKGSFQNLTCGGMKRRKCCVPNEEDKESWKAKDKVCLSSLGTCQVNLDACDGTYQAGTCGGPTQRQCCLPERTVREKWESNDGNCHEKWGTCQYKLDKCSGKYESDLCGGPEQRRCCIPDENEKSSWKDADTKCLIKFGQCQHKTQNCTGSYETGDDPLCGGPKYRQCCIPDSQIVSSWEADDGPCTAKGGTCQSNATKCNTAYQLDLCGGPKNIRQCCTSPAKEENNEQEDTNSNQESEHIPSTKHNQLFSDRKTLVLSIGIPVLVVLVCALFCMIRRRRCCCKQRRSLRGDPKKTPWYKMEYNELDEEDEGVNLTAIEESPSYA